MADALQAGGAGGGDSVGAVAGLAKDFVIVHNEIQTLRKEVGEMKKELTGLSSMQSEHLAALQSGKRSNSMVSDTNHRDRQQLAATENIATTPQTTTSD